ncbi:MAG TPA: filamentous hemagglutinin N-terminal domain-containing protein, partial [Herbaspirillum sp.]
MKTSLVSVTASSTVASTPVPASASVRADRPQQLKSATVYFRGRRMVLMQRPQRRLSLLLRRMLRRSMLNLLGRLPAKLAAPAKRVLSAGMLCAMALASATTAHATATVDQLPINTLPTDPSVISGKVGFDNSVANQLNVGIGSNKAIINWGSFSIGSAAGVDFHFNNATATSSVLNRVTGKDPSQIMGNLTSNGKVFLINSAGILVGKNAKIDVAGFVASTLNISNHDFRHGKMHFHNQHGVAAGNVEIQEDGSITTREGGSVYLIGANVENNGIINSPKGEVLLAAGKSVDLVDTGTPGVKIVVKGKQGKITNLGKIMAATGTIGFGAALIDNRGMINASSVDKAGGRIFLRASKDLTTSETSSINADGTTGGNVVLYADDTAKIDGDVSALGNADGKGGKGGYVDTSGKRQLSVMYAPRVGKGGEWYIDPYNVIIVGDTSPPPQGGQVDNGVDNDGHGVITANGTSSTIHVGTIMTQLDGGTNVTISTGTAGDGGQEAGNITINGDANIVKTAGGAATLKLDAIGSITISSGASIVDGIGGLGLILNAGGNIVNNGTITMRTGAMQVSGAGTSFANAGTINLGGGTLTSSRDIDNNTNGTIAGTGTIDLGLHTLTNNSGSAGSGHGGIIVGADDHTTGTLTINGNYTQSANGILKVKVGRGLDGHGPLEADKLVVNGNVNLDGKLQVDGQLQSDNTTRYTPMSGDKIAVLNYTGIRTGYFAAQTGAIDSMFANYMLLGANNVGLGYAAAGSRYFSGAVSSDWNTAANWSGNTLPDGAADVYIDVGQSNSVTHVS